MIYFLPILIKVLSMLCGSRIRSKSDQQSPINTGFESDPPSISFRGPPSQDLIQVWINPATQPLLQPAPKPQLLVQPIPPRLPSLLSQSSVTQAISLTPCLVMFLPTPLLAAASWGSPLRAVASPSANRKNP